MSKPVNTIGNPVSWILDALGSLARFATPSKPAAGTASGDRPEVATIGVEDLRVALRKGADDFTALRTDVIFIVLLYPVIGVCLIALAFQRSLLPLLFPLISGFALIGPIAAIGLYEMSRRRENGEPAGLKAATSVLSSPAIKAILAMGIILLAIFLAWMFVAFAIFMFTIGPEAPAGLMAFAGEVLGTPAGWVMIIVGCGVGFLFAAVTLSMAVISIPLIIHRHVGVGVAIATSFRLTLRNPVTIAIWGLIVAVTLFVGSLPLFVGLIFAFPILGHATWHLYRRALK